MNIKRTHHILWQFFTAPSDFDLVFMLISLPKLDKLAVLTAQIAVPECNEWRRMQGFRIDVGAHATRSLVYIPTRGRDVERFGCSFLDNRVVVRLRIHVIW